MSRFDAFILCVIVPGGIIAGPDRVSGLFLSETG